MEGDRGKVVVGLEDEEIGKVKVRVDSIVGLGGREEAEGVMGEK